MTPLQAIRTHQQQLRQCHACGNMIGPVVTGAAVVSPVMLIGQAPGDREGPAGKPFAWTAGKTLFGWFESIGLAEADFRQRVYMAAVCRCFPGKRPNGGDRVPGPQEIASCRRWLQREFELLRPQLLLPVGRLAISQFLATDRLASVIGQSHAIDLDGRETTLIPLPHPSGASTWHRTEPGKTLLQGALALIGQHPAWRQIVDGA